MKLDVAAASESEPEVVYEAASLRWGSLKMIEDALCKGKKII